MVRSQRLSPLRGPSTCPSCMAARLSGVHILLSVMTFGGCGAENEPTGPEEPLVASVVITPGSVTFASLDELKWLEATAYDAAGGKVRGKQFTWMSSDDDVATVSRLGLVTAVADGAATITAATDEMSGSASISIEQLPADIIVRPLGAALAGVGAKQPYEAEVYDGRLNHMPGVSVIWTSLNDKVATVDDAGLVTTVALGQTAIAATALEVTTGYGLVTVSLPGLGLITSWNSTAMDPPETLYGMWGASSSDVYVVGRGGTIHHHDGAGWTAMDSGVEDDLRDVWGSSADDVFAVGQGGTVLHYDGLGWSPMTSETSASLLGVWGASPNDVYAVGTRSTVIHYVGTEWRPRVVGDGRFFLNDVWGSSSREVFVVGGGGAIMRFDGIEWEPMISGTTQDLLAIWGGSSGDVFAVGGFGTILHYDGNDWTTMASGSTDDLWDVWGTSATDVYAAGGFRSTGTIATILHYDGAAWSIVERDAGPLFYGLWGHSSGVFALGEGGVIREGIR
jgi:hypothetical protein